MNSEQLALANALENKLRTVAALEQEVAPRGVNFAVRGQESVYKTGLHHLSNPEAAVDAVITALNEAKAMKGRRGELIAKAKILK